MFALPCCPLFSFTRRSNFPCFLYVPAFPCTYDSFFFFLSQVWMKYVVTVVYYWLHRVSECSSYVFWVTYELDLLSYFMNLVLRRYELFLY
jgi:hypothetical protein